MQRLLNRIPALSRLAFLPLTVLALIGLTPTPARAQLGPPNDYFTNAIVLTGPSGSVSGSNVNASLETGEVPVLGIGIESVWYTWTAPSSGQFTFVTEGSSFDTMLGVYTGASVDALTIVGENDDINYPTDASSKVSFAATAGTVYYIAVNGYPTTQPEGNIILTWTPSVSAGNFKFTSTLYIDSENETTSPHNPYMLAVPARLTVTRVGGSAGRVLVNYTLTNTLYTNFINFTNRYLDILTTNSGFFSNYFVTNMTVGYKYQDNQYGQFTYLPELINFSAAWGTNVGIFLTRTNYGLYDLRTNAPPWMIDCGNGTNVVTDTNTPPNTVVTIAICTNWTITNIVASATPNVDYIQQSGTLIFDDYQMSSDIFAFLNPTPPQARSPAVVPPGQLGTNLIVNRVLVATIDSVALDPLESTNIPPPVATGTNALLNILDQDTVAYPFVPDLTDPTVFDLWESQGRPGLSNIVNIERSTLRCTRDVNGQLVAHVAVIRRGPGLGVTCSFDYRIDFLSPDANNNNIFRGGGPSRVNYFMPLQAGSDYAIPPNPANNKYGTPPDFDSVTGTLTFPANTTFVYIDIPIHNYNAVEFNKDLLVEILNVSGTPAYLGSVRTCALTILFDDISGDVQPAGAMDRTHNLDNNSGTSPPYNPHPGANSTVYSVVVQPDGHAVFAGDFTAYNSTPRYRIARMLPNGQIDLSFNPQDGADAFITSVVLDPTNNIIVGGDFSSFNRIPRPRVARLLPTGQLDTTFFPGLGANGTVWQLALEADGKIFIAGEFTQFNTTNRNHIARLNADGSLDASFDPGAGANGPVYAIALQPDGRLIIGGNFSTVAGVSRSCIARLNTDGSLDTTFNPRSGAGGQNPVVYATAIQVFAGATNILVGGEFSAMYGVPRNNFARLLSDGSLDFGFTPGDGPDGPVYSIAMQPDGRIMINGLFRTVNQTRRVGIARLLNYGPVDTTFMDSAYNQFAGLPKHYYDPSAEPPSLVLAVARQPDGNYIIGGQFENVGGGFTRDDVRSRLNIARIIGGETPGPGNFELVFDNYSTDDFSETRFIEMMRTNGFLGPATVTVSPAPLPPGPGAAVAGLDYDFQVATPTYITTWPVTWQLKDGTYGQNQGASQSVDPTRFFTYLQNDVVVSIMQSTNLGDKYLNLQVSNPTDNDAFLLGGEKIPLGVALGRSLAQFEILDSHRNHGVFSFNSPTYIVAEGTNAVITVLRTGGSDGSVTVRYATSNGTATNGVQYIGTSGTNTFGQGVTNMTFIVATRDETVAEGDTTVNLTLSQPAGGATLGLLTNAVLTIVDNDCKRGGELEFSSSSYGVNENAGVAFVTVNRHTCSSGTMTVWLSTTGGTATNGVNYVGVTNKLTWNSGDVQPKTIAIPILDDNVIESSNLTVNLRLLSVTLNNVTNIIYLGSNSNAVLSITNTDTRGLVSFGSASYAVNENGGSALIPILRTGGAGASITVTAEAINGTAVNTVDFSATTNVFTFGPGEVEKTFVVPIIDNNHPDLPRYATLILTNASPVGSLTNPTIAYLNIIDDETFNLPPGGTDTTTDPSMGFNGNVLALALQPDGKLLAGGDFTAADNVPRNRIARLNGDGSLDAGFSSISASAGANDSVFAVIAQTDQRIVAGGRFTTMNGVNRNYLARLTLAGLIDSTFNPGSGPDSTVNAIAETFVGSSRKLLIGGAFTFFNSIQYPYLAQLNDDGSLDASFSPNPNGTVFAVTVQPDGKVLVGGDFTSINNVGRNHIARLNSNGTLDTSFDPGTGADASVRAIAVQFDGRILIGGLFTNVNNHALNRIARLDALGHVDSTFNPGAGANDLVTSISVQPDTRIVLGGQFTRCNGVTRNRLTRLNSDGSVDTMINFGAGANSFVAATLVQPDAKIVFGGGFTEYDGQPAPYLARIYAGSIIGSGSFEFDAGDYEVDEVGTNAVVNIRRRGGTSGTSQGPNVSVTFSTSDGTAVADTDHLGVTNYVTVITNLVFPPGEVLESVLVPVRRDFAITPDLTVNLTLSDPLPAVTGGPELGNQATAVLTILNDDGGVSFSSATYSDPENIPTGSALIPLVRSGSSRLPISVNFATTTNGTAIPGVNYQTTTNTVTFAAGQTSNTVFVPLLYNTNVTGNLTVVMELTNPVNTLLLNPATATLTIVDVDSLPGSVFFAQTNVVVNENAGSVSLTVLRANGHSGVISVNYATVPITAVPGTNYTTTSGSLSFADGETNKTITIPILEENAIEPGGFSTFQVNLSSPPGGPVILGSTNALVTIIDDDVGIAFTAPVYNANETDGTVTIGVTRTGTNGITTVSYYTLDGTAISGANHDYNGVTNTLIFNPNESLKTFPIFLHYDPKVTGDKFFTITLTNASAPGQITGNNPATVVVADVDPGVAFATTNYFGLKSGTNVVISVVRSNANTGTVSVSFATTNNGTAQPNFDYAPTNGILTFSNGVVLQTFAVQLINNGVFEGDRTFGVFLFTNAQSGRAQLLAPTNALVTITDDISGLSFSAPAYSVGETGGFALIPVVRTGFTNSAVSVKFAAAGGSAIPWPAPNANYFPTNGTLNFAPGEVVKTFAVNVIDDSILTGDHTVLLTLSNVVGNAVIISPPSATLTIVEADGSFIVEAGAALIQESFVPANGVIDPGEQVRLLFALRNEGGNPTTNLWSTLLATNGVIPVGTISNYYGVLTNNGPSFSQPFSFIANGTNGQTISATFRLQDGSFTTNVTFSFTLGTSSSSFTNPAAIIIPDSGPGSIYPSTINVSGVGGTVSKTTVTLTNFNHSYPRDVDILLVSPTGQKSYLMAKCGGTIPVNNVTLTFDDAAGSNLPSSTQLASGTYRPSSYAMAPPPFPSPAPAPDLLPSPHYNTNLSVFNGINPNGIWSLYVYDDTSGNSGSIANGWKLTLATTNPVVGAADLVVSMSVIPTNNIVSVYGNLTYTVTVFNAGPSPAANVVVTNSRPATATFNPGASSAGADSNTTGLEIYRLGTLAKDATTNLTITVTTLAANVTVTDIVWALSDTPDRNLSNNTNSITSTVTNSADLSLTLVASPDPAFAGFTTVTYTLTVGNAGPSTATSVVVSNTLPTEMRFVDASPHADVFNGTNIVFSLGDRGVGTNTLTIHALPLLAGLVTNTASISSPVFDPAKANNFASVKTLIEPALTTTQAGPALVNIAWRDKAVLGLTDVFLETSTSLAGGQWTRVTTPQPTFSDDWWAITVGTTDGIRFFRLHGQR